MGWEITSSITTFHKLQPDDVTSIIIHSIVIISLTPVPLSHTMTLRPAESVMLLEEETGVLCVKLLFSHKRTQTDLVTAHALNS